MLATQIPFDSIPALSSLQPRERELVAPLCRMRHFDRGEVIFQEGEQARWMHFIHRGKVKVVKAGPGRDIILEILGQGEPVGIVAVLKSRAFPATAVTLEPSDIISIPETEFFRLVETCPEITRHMLAGLTLRLIALNRRLGELTGSVEHRAAALFLTLGDRVGQNREDGLYIPLTLTRQEIADLLGTTIETAIRLMSRWNKEGLIVTEKTGFLLPDPAELRKTLQE